MTEVLGLLVIGAGALFAACCVSYSTWKQGWQDGYRRGYDDGDNRRDYRPYPK